MGFEYPTVVSRERQISLLILKFLGAKGLGWIRSVACRYSQECGGCSSVLTRTEQSQGGRHPPRHAHFVEAKDNFFYLAAEDRQNTRLRSRSASGRARPAIGSRLPLRRSGSTASVPTTVRDASMTSS
jgi:hypothetical protein